MTKTDSTSSLAIYRRHFDDIWWQYPEHQNRTSTSWWFVLLFPWQGDSYGPQQLMFTICARAGEHIVINDRPLAGLGVGRAAPRGHDEFEAIALGWYNDGETHHHDIVKETAVTTLSKANGAIHCRVPNGSGPGYGLSYTKSLQRSMGMRVQACGRDGPSADFEVWGDLDSPFNSPNMSMQVNTRVGGVNYIGWRRLHFSGEFDLPDGRRHLSGMGFFQRVALNAPLFPWKWIYAMFPDGSVFTAYVPYIGLNLLRRGYRFFSREWLEHATASIRQTAAWMAPGAAEPILFNRASVKPVLRMGGDPDFLVACHSPQGDRLSFLASTYGHTHYYVDNPLLGGLLTSQWNYNEYVFRMDDLDGRIGGRAINRGSVGQAYGSLEYTYGLGL